MSAGEILWEEGSDAAMAVIVGAGAQMKLFKSDGTATRVFGRGVFICDVDGKFSLWLVVGDSS